MVHRHTTLRAFLSKVLGMDPQAADEGACRLEHAVSGQVIDRLVKFVKYFETCPAADIRWDDEAGYFCGNPNHEHDGTCGRDVCGHGLDLQLPDPPGEPTDAKEN